MPQTLESKQLSAQSLGQKDNRGNNLIYSDYFLTRLITLYFEVLLEFQSTGSQHNEIISSTEILPQDDLSNWLIKLTIPSLSYLDEEAQFIYILLDETMIILSKKKERLSHCSSHRLQHVFVLSCFSHVQIL